ncbi:MAG TPA: hypothetical protein VHY22_18475 [Chthoniobacteraceae bacterium]|jgi:hypothetical protein|nr:hypothetical protein [Chthoniobacteraceae bacterium]
MSLRAFHIFFIALVTILSLAISALVFSAGFDPRFGAACAVFGLAFAVYGVWFLRKSRKLIL